MNSGPSIRRISRSANNPTAGPLTGKPASRLVYWASTLIISMGMMGRPQGEADASAYQGVRSVMAASLSASENG